MLKTTRVENKLLQTVDFVMADGTVVFRTCKEEQDKVVFQMGTADPARALKTALHVVQDVCAIDVNMGCPKDYSVKGGMGAALLTKPEKVYDILTTLVKGIHKPVTCKIRILPTVEESVKLAKLIESTGVAALAVHGREKHERSLQPVHNDVLGAIADALSIPVIANGGSLDITTFEEMKNYRQQTRCSSVMVARAAQWNFSVFRKEGPLPTIQVIKEYIKTAIDYDNFFSNTKYCVLILLHEEHTGTELAKKLTASKNIEEICAAVDLLPYYKNCLERQATKNITEKETTTSKPTCTVAKRKLSDTGFCELIEMKIKYKR
ncbi:hypothetical protein QZH41_016225 [Actinostola sp. cb2023]|nr:hypothetical protein QZH41_016225 [Actinostola sp. cb2023]